MKINKTLIKYRFLFMLLLITIVACSDDDQAIDEDLLDVVWRVDTLTTPEGQITPGPDTLMTIQFSRSLEVSGNVLCNTYSGIYEINKNVSLSADVKSWTEIACGGGRLRLLHEFFINAIEKVTDYELDKDRLTLYDSDRDYLIILRN